MQLRNKFKNLNWDNVAWYTFGYLALVFFTIVFALACLRGRQVAAVNSLVICSVLLYCLPPHKR